MSYKKHPKSIAGRQCISPCYAPDVIYTHPKTLENIHYQDHSSCAVDPFEDPISKTRMNADICESSNLHTSDSKLDLLTPYIDFNQSLFLERFYGIKNVSDFFTYINNNQNMPILTYERLLNCFIGIFGKTVTIIDDSFAKMTYKLIKKYWIKLIYKKIANHINCNEHDCYVVSPKQNNLNKHDFVRERIKFLMSILTESVIEHMSNDFFSEFSQSEQQTASIDDFKEFIVKSTEKILSGMTEK